MFQIPYYLSSFNDNYIMFRNVENFPKQSQTTKNCQGKILNFQEYSIF